jgi:hypothetical protein
MLPKSMGGLTQPGMVGPSGISRSEHSKARFPAALVVAVGAAVDVAWIDEQTVQERRADSSDWARSALHARSPKEHSGA